MEEVVKEEAKHIDRPTRGTNHKVPTVVITTAVEKGVVSVEGIPANAGDATLKEWLGRQMWRSDYRSLKVDAAGSSRGKFEGSEGNAGAGWEREFDGAGRL
ncbi:hypothetical protein BDZ91DRAFT_797076 [Kalaharituber pfeilii]|nr:hypothetical protein BDZ91DRAFT_797076 [Kalaharituber pfeilii]